MDSMKSTSYGSNASPCHRSTVELCFGKTGLIDIDWKLLERPDRASIEVFDSFENRDPPVTPARLDVIRIQRFEDLTCVVQRAVIAHKEPVQGTRANIARWARMHDERQNCAIYLSWYSCCEKGTNDNVRIEQFDRIQHGLV